MKTKLKTVLVRDKVQFKLLFVCPGCMEIMGSNGLHFLTVNSPHIKPSWEYDGNVNEPTLSPSILTYGRTKDIRCHSFLRKGVFEFLNDSTHSMAGQQIELPELPTWAEELT